MTNSIAEIEDAQCMFVIGSNTTEAHPVLALRMKTALRRGAKLIVADPRRTWLAERAHIHLPLKPGTDIPLLNAMAHVILAEGLQDQGYVENLTEGFDEARVAAEAWPPERAAEVCGVSADAIREAARIYATTDRSGGFAYRDGELVTFSLGGFVLGTVRGRSKVSPVELVDDAKVLRALLRSQRHVTRR